MGPLCPSRNRFAFFKKTVIFYKMPLASYDEDANYR